MMDASTSFLIITLMLPLFGATIVAFVRRPSVASRWSLAFLVGMLITASGASLSFETGAVTWLGNFGVDPLAKPMLPVFAILHLLTMLGTAKSRVTPQFCIRLLLSAFISVATLTSQNTSGLVLLLILGVLLPLWDLKARGERARGYLLYMLVFIVLLGLGWSLSMTPGNEWALGLLLVALLVRGGIVPVHGWLPTLFQGAAFGTAMVFVLPLIEVLASLRLLLPLTPEWMLNVGSTLCLITSVYGGGMAIVQKDVRRFFAHLCVSQTSLVLFAVMLHTSNGLTAALCLWISSTLALTGLAFSMRALEARFGSLSLREHHGFYEQVPGLAICFLLTGLACVGFPGTIGFVPMELLISGSVDQGLHVSFTLAIAAMLNGIAILRAYFALFTGKRPTTSVSLQTTPVERAGIIVILLIVFLGGWFSPNVVASRHQTADQLLQRGGLRPVQNVHP